MERFCGIPVPCTGSGQPHPRLPGSLWIAGTGPFPANHPTSTLLSHFPSLSCCVPRVQRKDGAQRAPCFACPGAPPAPCRRNSRPCSSPALPEGAADPEHLPPQPHPTHGHGGRAVPTAGSPARTSRLKISIVKKMSIFTFSQRSCSFPDFLPEVPVRSVLKSHGPKSNTTGD